MNDDAPLQSVRQNVRQPDSKDAVGGVVMEKTLMIIDVK
jgi:hypothetical protein